MKHGLSKTRFYGIWHKMKERCSNKNYIKYYSYGGRGISVCDEWKIFTNFRDDMYNNYKSHIKEFGIKDTSIDRIDNDGNYNKENCRWATIEEQGRNKSIKRIDRSIIPEWLNYDAYCKRKSRGWTIEKILTQPLRHSRLGCKNKLFTR